MKMVTVKNKKQVIIREPGSSRRETKVDDGRRGPLNDSRGQG